MFTRTFLSLLVLSSFLLSLSACQPSPLVSTVGSGTPSLLWKHQTSGGIVATPFVHKERVLVGNTSGAVTAVSLKSGALLWKKQVHWGVWAKIAWVAPGYLVVSRDGLLHSLSARGKPLWRRKIADSILSSPAQDDTRILWTGLGTNLFLFLQKPEVHRVWAYSTRGPLYSSPILRGNGAYFGAGDGAVYAVDVVARKLLWRFSSGSPVEATPRVTNDLVLVGNTSGRVVALERKTGRLRWSTSLSRGCWSTPAVSKELVYVGCNDRALHALSLKDGSLRWRFVTRRELSSSPLLYRGRLIFGGRDGAVRGLDAKTGKLRWRVVTGAAIEGDLLLHQRTLLFGANDGALTALKLPKGTKPDGRF